MPYSERLWYQSSLLPKARRTVSNWTCLFLRPHLNIFLLGMFDIDVFTLSCHYTVFYDVLNVLNGIIII